MTQLFRILDSFRNGNIPKLGVSLLVASLVWLCWPDLVGMADRWTHDSRYSHGPLVPLFSIWLLWHRQSMLTIPKTSWWGLALVALGAGIKLFGTFYFLEAIDHVALLPMIAGVFVLVGGWPYLRWAWPSIVFLVFMIPLPYRVEHLLGLPLQRIATIASTYTLQTLGLPAVSEGNIILIDESRIGVVEACNGLGMLFMFFAFTTAAILATQRPLLDRVLIFLSAVPISLFANIVRISLTGFLHMTVGGKTADVFYHDMAGWLMMPLALALLWGEIVLLTRMFIEPSPPGQSSVFRQPGLSIK